VEHPPPILGVMYTTRGCQCRAELAEHGVTHLALPIPRPMCWVVWFLGCFASGDVVRICEQALLVAVLVSGGESAQLGSS